MKTKPDTVRAPRGALYRITELVGENQNFRFYGVESEDFPEQSIILKIVTDKAFNHMLEREAFLLNTMSEEAIIVDEEYSATHNGQTLNYQIGFPKLIDNFISEEDGGRRILILGLTMSDTPSKIVPVNMITEGDKMRVDAKTSVWVLGKLLKIIAFAHDRMLVTVGNLDSENIFIVKENHLVSVFDWSQSVIYPLSVPKNLVIDELRQAVKVTLVLLGGDPEKGTIPDHEQLQGEGERYRTLLNELLKKDFESVHNAHRYFYEVVEEIWERKYHPFTDISM